MTVPAAEKVVLITGAATGIGAATARAFAGSGFTVVGVDVDRVTGEALFAELGIPHEFHVLDVRDATAWTVLVSAIFERFGRLDVVHLNAGVMMRPKGAAIMDDPLAWFSPETWGKVRSVNLDGVAFGIMATMAVPRLSCRWISIRVIRRQNTGCWGFPWRWNGRWLNAAFAST